MRDLIALINKFSTEPKLRKGLNIINSFHKINKRGLFDEKENFNFIHDYYFNLFCKCLCI